MTRAAPSVTVAGGGLAGALLACYLGRRGVPTRVYERRPDIRRAALARGRSINLAISERGLRALRDVDMEERILSMCVPMRGRMMHGVDGELTFQPYGTRPEHVINSVSRAELNRVLLDAAEAHGCVELLFDHKCVDLDLAGPRCRFETPRSDEALVVSSDIVVGADGAFSAVRQRLQRRDRFSYSQSYLAHGYQELHIPAREDGGFRLDPHALHIWPRHQFMMIALPNADGTFTATLFWPLEGEHCFANLTSERQVREYFERWFPDAVPHMPTLVEDYLAGAPGSLVTVRCEPWTHGGCVTLVGDACHAVVPFYGQGMNAAFEDCRILAECLTESVSRAEGAGDREAGDWDRRGWQLALERYGERRKRHVDALADLAIANFVEMRDHVTSPLFLLGKRLDKAMHRVAPRLYLPLYAMVSFSNRPYADAVERSRRQLRVLKACGALLLVTLLIVLVRLL